MKTGFEINIKAKSRTGRDKLMSELVWLLHKSESGDGKQLKKLHNWLSAHDRQVKFKTEEGEELSGTEFYDMFYDMAEEGITDSEMVIAEVDKNGE